MADLGLYIGYLMTAECFIASALYFLASDHRRGWYFLLAGGINLTVVIK